MIVFSNTSFAHTIWHFHKFINMNAWLFNIIWQRTISINIQFMENDNIIRTAIGVTIWIWTLNGYYLHVRYILCNWTHRAQSAVLWYGSNAIDWPKRKPKTFLGCHLLMIYLRNTTHLMYGSKEWKYFAIPVNVKRGKGIQHWKDHAWVQIFLQMISKCKMWLWDCAYSLAIVRLHTIALTIITLHLPILRICHFRFFSSSNIYVFPGSIETY